MRVDRLCRSSGEALHGGIDFAELARHGVAADQVIDFSSNVLSGGPSAAVRKAIAHAVSCEAASDGAAIQCYPDRECHRLRESIAQRFAIDAQWIMVGNGCSELIHLIAGALLEAGDSVMIVGPTFSEYARATRIAGGIVEECHAVADTGFAVPREEIAAALAKGSTKLVWICNPNNPTGQSVSSNHLLDWVQSHPGTMFVIDESYIEFAAQGQSLIRCALANLIVLRSMTKSHALAGLRLGFVVACERLLAKLRDRRVPWSVNSLAQAAGIAALADPTHLDRGLVQLAGSKRRLLRDLASHGFTAIASDTGFFLLAVDGASGVRERLLREGLLVRDCQSFGIRNHLRIAVQADADNRRLVAALVAHTAEPTADRIEHVLGQLCKPPGSLGELERIARRLCRIQGTTAPLTQPRSTTIFAADHGVTVEGVTAWPSGVTRAVVELMRRQRTASGVFARSLGCAYEVVDVGLIAPLEVRPPEAEPHAGETPLADTLHRCAVRRGTGNLRCEAAMTQEDFAKAWRVGVERAAAAADAGNRLLIGGEMGIGNTTAASCLVCLLADASIEDAVGRGAGIDDEGLARKQRVVADAVARVRALGKISVERMACEVGGLEIVALAGFYAEAARRELTIVLDGFIATSAALVAEAVRPGTCQYMIAGHRSREPGHILALRVLQLEPVLDMKLRLGEATGALTALPLLDLAAAMIREMATLDELVLE